MDIVNILRGAVNALPEGDHSMGLRAILRHLDSAIRHYNRDPATDHDCYTDSIYRTNQAYEGSLKEAYRVLENKDPSKKTPNEIEEYLETNKTLRPRVLVQLSRYRQDYRNPSTHDYKLDFDENEALLAIVSVCAFGKLLVDQISEKIAFDKSLTASSAKKLKLSGSDGDIALEIANFFAEIVNKDDRVKDTASEFKGFLSGQLVGAGLGTDDEYESERAWDLVVTTEDKRFAVELRLATEDQDTNHILPVHYLNSGIIEESLNGGLILTRSKSNQPYGVITVVSQNGQPLYLINRLGFNEVRSRLGEYWTMAE